MPVFPKNPMQKQQYHQKKPQNHESYSKKIFMPFSMLWLSCAITLILLPLPASGNLSSNLCTEDRIGFSIACNGTSTDQCFSLSGSTLTVSEVACTECQPMLHQVFVTTQSSQIIIVTSEDITCSNSTRYDNHTLPNSNHPRNRRTQVDNDNSSDNGHPNQPQNTTQPTSDEEIYVPLGFYLYPGEPCHWNMDCYSNSCVQNTCVGEDLGSHCDEVNHLFCAKSLSCIDSICVQDAAEGSPCSSDIPCDNRSYCLDGLCQPIGGIPIGEQTNQPVSSLVGVNIYCESFLSSFDGLCMDSSSTLTIKSSESYFACGWFSHDSNTKSGGLPSGIIDIASKLRKNMLISNELCPSSMRMSKSCRILTASFDEINEIAFIYSHLHLLLEMPECLKNTMKYKQIYEIFIDETAFVNDVIPSQSGIMLVLVGGLVAVMLLICQKEQLSKRQQFLMQQEKMEEEFFAEQAQLNDPGQQQASIEINSNIQNGILGEQVNLPVGAHLSEEFDEKYLSKPVKLNLEMNPAQSTMLPGLFTQDVLHLEEQKFKQPFRGIQVGSGAELDEDDKIKHNDNLREDEDELTNTTFDDVFNDSPVKNHTKMNSKKGKR